MAVVAIVAVLEMVAEEAVEGEAVEFAVVVVEEEKQ